MAMAAMTFALVPAGQSQTANTNPPGTLNNSEPTRLPEVVVSGTMIGSKSNVSLLPGSAAYLDTEDIRLQSASDINRVLRLVPGVYVREEDGYGLFPNLSLRGVDPGRSGKVTVMEDGILSAPAPYSAPSAYYSPNVARMSALEIQKGSSQVKYGPHITGGVINYVSTPVPVEQTTYLKTYYGSYNEIFTHAYHGESFDLENAGRVGYLVEGFFQQTDGFKTIDATPDFSDRDDTGFHRAEPMVKLYWEPATSVYHRFELKYGYTDLEADETYLGLNSAEFGQDPFRRYAASRFDHIDTYHHRSYLRHIMEPLDNLRITTTGYYNQFHRNWSKLNDLRGPNLSLGQALEDTSPGGGLDILSGRAPGTLRFRNNNRDYDLAGVQSSAQIGFDTGPLEHQFEAGVRYHYDRVDRFQWDETLIQAANGTITGRTVGAMGAAGDRVQESNATALFAQDQIRYNRFIVTPGIRYEFIDQEYEQDQRRADGGGSPARGEGDMDVLAGGVGLSYQWTPEWTPFAGVYRGFSVPGPRAAIRNNLEEETSMSIETGMRYSGRQGIQAEAVYFHTDFNDLIVGDNIAGTGSPTTENAGDIEVNGVELSLGYDPGTYLDWAVRTPMQLAFTYTDARLDGDSLSTDPESIFSGGVDGNRVPYIPEYQLTAQLGLEFNAIGLYATGTYVPSTFTTANNTSMQMDLNGTPDARFGRTDSYFLLDVTARYQFNESGNVFVGIKNLLDREYVAARHPHGPRPGLPRMWNVGVELMF